MALPAIDPLPTPPSRSDAPATFITRADAFVAAMAVLATQMNAFGEAVEEAAQATNYNATSSSSVAIGTGSKSFTASTGRLLKAGQFVSIASASGPGNAMLGTVISYDPVTGALVVNVTAVTGSGTFDSWMIALSVNPAVLSVINAAIAALQGDVGVLSGEVSALAPYRGIPQTSQNGNFTLALTDLGGAVYSENTGAQTITVPPNSSAAFPLNTVLTIINEGTSNITLSQGSGVTLRLAGSTSTGNRTVVPGGIATLKKVKADRWIVSGPGVS
ncbi:hypothetical protein FHS51_001426 [Sphingobium wenxiniae]|uniref:Uncharacterized protein n=1 Tax=Sphingobium wenxiniae (strain DSM 21828 / CGMCC 1.7748 / JZ-1) TaxID=595605 RepID=A0A562KKU2_SPHWJ|nr:hypothetical protein [Sphingobium wenxiniae]MBB6191204.1 hypothetical protein [Sphingobium wenxiniae]TWH95997.1 hypothetical protein IQ35_01086 [Sphingobium wenxiniae]